MGVTLRSVGRYRLASLIERTLQGELYKAFDPAERRFVALLLLRRQEGAGPLAGGRGAFEAAAEAAAALHHPNILTTHGHGESSGHLYLVTELLEARTLGALIDEGCPAPKRALGIARQILAALAHAHAAGLLHGGLTPSEVLLSGEGTVKVKAFWGARRLAAVAEAERPYLAPEQVVGGAIDARTDVYAAGALLYRLLAGVAPCRGRGPALIDQIKRNAPRPPSVFGGEGVATFDEVVLQALAKRPQDRFPSATAFAEALQRASGVVEKPVAPAHGRSFGRRRLAVGDMVFREGDIGDCAYLIAEGSVQITKGGGAGAPIVLATLGRGEIVGEMALVDDHPRMADAVAAEDAELVVIPRGEFRQRLERMDKVTLRLIEVLVGRLRNMAEEVTALKSVVE